MPPKEKEEAPEVWTTRQFTIGEEKEVFSVKIREPQEMPDVMTKFVCETTEAVRRNSVVGSGLQYRHSGSPARWLHELKGFAGWLCRALRRHTVWHPWGRSCREVGVGLFFHPATHSLPPLTELQSAPRL